ncbi:hypothetical protein IWW56_002254 [Coemansia sp. RSA 2131]|nr:hypothetical protein IWW56_002254 [Coemansia sp. RSA 2131]
MLNKCLANADHQCIQALLLQQSWVYGHAPMDMQILVHHILKEQYLPVTDTQPAVSTKKPAASNDKVFKDHSRHTFNQFILTDGVSLCVVCWTVEVTLAKKAAGEKRKHNQLAQQAQQTQPVQLPVQQVQPPLQLVAQQMQLPTGPPVRLPMVIPAQQAWMPMITLAQQTWMPMGPPTGLLVQPTGLPMGPPAQQAQLLTGLPVQPMGPPMGLPPMQQV